MNHRTAKGIIVIITALCLCLLAGCASQKHYEKVEKRALEYYQEKYGLEDITITDSYKAGNNGLFGFLDVKDRAYEMSDGNSVFWDDDAEKFSDNAQAEEINEAFRSEILEPLISNFIVPVKIAGSVMLNRTGMDSFDECVFNEIYKGDIHEFVKKELPLLEGFIFAIETTDRDKGEREITDLYTSLDEYVRGWSNAYILNEGLEDLTGDDWTVDTHKVNVTAAASHYFGEAIRWYRQEYIEVYKGLYVTSHKMDFVFEEGDVIFEEAGTCAELQQMLDDGYYSMPVDAEENKSGGYHVHDQRHESRVVLDDTTLPYYRLKLSQRVLDALDERREISVYFLDLREDDKPLMMYYGSESRYPFSVYPITRDRSGAGEYGTLNPDCIYYFGTHQLEAYEG